MQSIRGMHDILPGEIEYWQHIYLTALRILGLASYKEIRTPILESTSLFLRSIGEGTDIVNKEMYSFIDQHQRQLTLRPENTASIARAVIQHNLVIDKTIQRLWYLGPMFRYERPQRGRQRQFHQLGLECCGSPSPIVDAEIIYLAKHLLDTLNCQNYQIEVNSLGTLKDRQKYQVVLKNYLEHYIHDLDEETRIKLRINPIKLLDSKNNSLKAILNYAPKLIDYLDISSIKHLENVKEYLTTLNIAFNLNLNLVRGLDYYTNTVFEIKTNLLDTQDTICGGGRYNGLIEKLGGPSIASAGWAIGIERLLLLIKHKIELNHTPLIFYIATQGHEARKYALTLLATIQKYQLRFEIDLSDSNFNKQLKKANQHKAMICLIIGEYEVANKYITLKWLQEHYQIQITSEEFIITLQKIKNPYIQYNT